VGQGNPDGRGYRRSLGGDQAGFVIFNQELSDLVLAEDTRWDVLTIDLRHAYLNNGGEQAWFASGTRQQEQVPEPSNVALPGPGLSAFGLWRRRKARKLVH